MNIIFEDNNWFYNDSNVEYYETFKVNGINLEIEYYSEVPNNYEEIEEQIENKYFNL